MIKYKLGLNIDTLLTAVHSSCKSCLRLVSSTLESGIDGGQGINVGLGKFVKKNKRRALNKRRA